jgi:cytoskeletal protein CcmA (bactofilin family)
VAGGDDGEQTAARQAVLDGVLRMAGDLRITGRAKGELHCDGTLTIAEGAQVDAHVVAGQLIVAGTLAGDITCCGKLRLLPTARVTGRLITAALAIEDGARYEGELRMASEEEVSQPAGQAAGADLTVAAPDAAVLAAPQPAARTNQHQAGAGEAARLNGAGAQGG